MGNDSKVRQYYADLKKRTLLVINGILGNEEANKIDILDKQLLKANAPKTYSGTNGKEVQMMKGFIDTCNIIVQHVQRDPKKMSTLEYYQTIEFIKEKLKKEK